MDFQFIFYQDCFVFFSKTQVYFIIDGDSAANIRVKDVVIGELIKLQEETESYKLKGGQDEAQSQFR